MRCLRSLLLCVTGTLLVFPALAQARPSVAINPGYTTIGVSTTQQYTATVTGLSNAAVVWKVNGIVGGSPTLGTISPSGLYHAPAKIPATDLTITAAASDKATSATVYVVVAAAGPTITKVSPESIPVGNYTATVTGAGFGPDSKVKGAGIVLATTVVNSTTLTVTGYQGTGGAVAFQVQNSGTLPGPVFSVPFLAPVGLSATAIEVAQPVRQTVQQALTSPRKPLLQTEGDSGSPTGPVSIRIVSPLYGWQVVPGATRRIHASASSGPTRRVTWSYTTDGGATATITPAVAPNLPGAFVDVSVGAIGSKCVNTGGVAEPVFSSAATVKLTATSVDDPTKSATVPIAICKPPVQVFVSPFNERLYSGQMVDLQSWVWGVANDNVVWTITQPTGGDGRLIVPPSGGSASTSRDAVFSATAAGIYTVTAASTVHPGVSASATLSVDSVPMPYPVTRNHTAPVDCSVEPTKSGKTYDIGVGHPYASLAAAYVAIGNTILNPGTTIRLFNTDTTGSNPTRFHEYLRLDGQGTQVAPIRVVGCADAAGNLPILDAENATAYSKTDNSAAARISGLYQIALHHSGAFAAYPTSNAPSYIIIEGLAFRNAYPPNNFYAPGSTTLTPWGTSTSCIRPYEGSHITVRGNDMQDCSFGILGDFNGNNAWGGFFGDLDLEGNYFTNIGAANQSEHMAYVQGFRQLIQGNVFDRLKPVSQSGDLKMRGVAEIVRYNLFNSSTNTRTIDFVEEQDSNIYMSFLGYFYAANGHKSFRSQYPDDAYTPDLIASADEAWHKAYVYGNIINFGPNAPMSQAPIHFFGDQGPYGDQNTNPPVRVGDLFTYNNTIYSVGRNSLHLIDTMQNQDNQIRWEWPTLTLWNNAVFVGPLNPNAGVAFQMSTLRSDIFKIGPMWLSSNWGTNTLTCSNNANNQCLGTGWPHQMETTQYMDGGNLPAHVTGLSNLITGGSTVPFDTTTWVPTSGGGLIGKGAALPEAVSNMPVRFQMNPPSYSLTLRKSPLTLGAHD